MATDPSIIGSVLAFLVAIGILIAVHEYGHYIVGRCCNMKVLRFSIGFGKPLLRRVAGADRTEYVVAAVPSGSELRFCPRGLRSIFCSPSLPIGRCSCTACPQRCPRSAMWRRTLTRSARALRSATGF